MQNLHFRVSLVLVFSLLLRSTLAPSTVDYIHNSPLNALIITAINYEGLAAAPPLTMRS